MNPTDGSNDVKLVATWALYNALSFTQEISITIWMEKDEEPVALQVIEFWSSISDEEIDILEYYGGDFTADSKIPCFYFIKQALPALVPMLLETL
ncbi:importin subunit beta-1 [Tanacetum coccineum]|uniref:Importin subunit beta-1 n=1 Tax=Tanacetum coccineum TaxID=301880 RepID=A0ABQ5IHK0_9ASTR